MAGTKHSENFDELVESAYTTLLQQIRELPDFPGIQVVDEPPEYVSKRRKRFPPGKETLGLYSGVRRTERRHNDVRLSPDLIFVFRGPIQRCSRGDLRAEVKEVVWHEVAHWLGYSEQEVKELGLSTLTIPPERATLRPGERTVSSNTTLQPPLADTLGEADDSKEPQLRCLKCYSANVTCRELDKPLSTGSWLGEPVSVRANVCKCNSCGHEWADEDN